MKKIVNLVLVLTVVALVFGSCIAINYENNGGKYKSYLDDMNTISSNDFDKIIFQGSDDIEIVFSAGSDIPTVSGYSYKSEFSGNELIIRKSQRVYINAKIMPEIVFNGSGDVKLKGSIESIKVLNNGSGDLDASKLEVKNLTFDSNGSGDARVHASEKADVTLNGSGKVRIKGSPKLVNKMGAHAYNIK